MRGLAPVLAILMVAPPALAAPWQCVLWPRTCAVAPVDIPAPPPVPPAVTVAPAAKPPEVSRTIRKMKAKPRPAVRRAPGIPEAGPDLPWPCWLVRLNARGKTSAELEQLGRDRGVTLTPKQRRQARACIVGKS